MTERFDDWSVTAGSNSTVDSISIAENMAPGNVNNAMRAIMAAAALSFGGFPEGSSRPAIVAAGSFWLDTTTAAAPVVKFYDGSDDITFATFDYSANTVVFSGSTAAASVTVADSGGYFDGTDAETVLADIGANYAKLAGPTFTGDPKAPTASSGDDSTSIATTAFVTTAITGVITRFTAKTTTSGSTKTFTGISAGTNRITVMYDGVSLSGGNELMIQIGDAGGYETSGYKSSAGDDAGRSQSTAGFLINHAASAADLFSGETVLARLDGNVWVAHGAAAKEGAHLISAAGSKTLTAELDRLKITRTGSDTFDAGIVNIFTE